MRPAAWGLVALGVAFFAVYLYLGSRGFSERLRRGAEERLGEALDREVRIGSLRLDLLPLAVEVEGLEIAGASAGTEPLASVERAVLEARVALFLKPGIYLDDLLLENPRFRMSYDEEGRHDLPRMAARRRGGGGGGLPVELEIGRVQIVGGELEIDHRRIPLELDARNLRARFAGTGDDLELRGSATAEEVSLELRGSKPYLGSVEVEGLVRSHRFDFERLQIEGPDLDARGDGFVRWRGDREVLLRLDASGDLRVFERLGFLEGQTAGAFEFSGSMTRKPGVLLLEGDVISPRARLFGRTLRNLRARVEGDRNTVQIEAKDARYGSGSVGALVRLGLAVDRGRVDLDLNLDRVPLDQLLADQNILIEGLGGAVSGAFNYQFETRDARGGNGWADLVISDEVAPDPGDLPLAGTAPLVIGNGVIRSEALRLTSSAQQLTASGFYDLRSSRGSYDVELSSDRVSEILALVPGSAEPGPGTAWRPSDGRGHLEGTLTLDGPRTRFETRLDLEDLVATGYRAERMLGNVALDRAGVRDLRLELARGDAALIVSGTLPFDEESQDSPPPPLELALDAAGWPLDEADAWLPFELPIRGRYTGGLELEGSLASPDARLAGRVAPVRFRDLEAPSLGIETHLSGERVEVERSVLAVSGGTVEASGFLDRSSGELSFEIGSTPLDLHQGQIAAAVGADIGGRLQLEGRVLGTLEQPEVEAQLLWSDVEIAGQPLPQDERPQIELTWSGSELGARGSVLGLVDVEGGGQATTERVDFKLELTGGRLDRVARLVGGEPFAEIAGSFAGELAVGAEAGDSGSVALEDLSVGLRLDRLVAERGEIRLANLEPVEAELDAGRLRIRSLYLGDEEAASELFVGGEAVLGDDPGLDFHLQASLATEWLEPLLRRQWSSARLSRGVFEGIGSLTGSLASPRFNGVGEIVDGQVTADELPTSLDRVSATLLFYPDQVVVEDSRATLAGGDLRAGGSIDLSDPGEAVPYQFQIRGEHLSYRLPQGFLIRGDFDLSLSSTADGRQLSGLAKLDRVYYLDDVKVGLEQALATLFTRQRLEAGPTDELRSTTVLNLQVEGENSLRVRNNLADLRGGVDLLLRGTLARPVVFGTVEIERGGSLVYSGNDYEVELGTLTFNNPHRIEPVIDLLARSRQREYEITLGLSGTLDRLTIDLASNPPLADLEVLALLTGSSATASTGSGTGRDSGDVGAEGFLYGQATSLVAQRFNRLFGLDELRIDPLTSSTGSLSSARVTVGKQLSRDLAATYSWDPSQTGDEILELEWSVSRSLVLVLTQNGDGTYALDARWEKRL